MTASMDMFPRQLRRSGRRELLILAISVTCCLIGLFLVTEVSGRGGASPEVGGATRSSLLVLVSSPLVSGDRNQTQAGLSRKMNFLSQGTDKSRCSVSGTVGSSSPQ